MKNTNYKRTITYYGKEVMLWSKKEDLELIELKKELIIGISIKPILILITKAIGTFWIYRSISVIN